MTVAHSESWAETERMFASLYMKTMHNSLYHAVCNSHSLRIQAKGKKCLIPLRRYNLLSSEIWGRESNVEAQKKNSPYPSAEEFHIKWPVLPTYTEHLVSVPIDSITYEGTVKNKRKLVE